MSALRYITVILILALAACSSPEGNDAGSPPQRAAAPPHDYIHIGSADTRQSGNIQIGVNTDLFGGDEAVERLAITFGIYFSSAVHDATPSEIGNIGKGSSVTDPIVFSPPVEPVAELQSAVNLVAKRAVDRRHLVGSLYRSPEGRYLLLIEFDREAGALYFDVTNWAKAKGESD